MPRSKLGELQLKSLDERIQARTTAQQDVSDDATAVPVKKKRGPQAVRGAGFEQGAPVARRRRPADAPPCPENCHDGGCAACMPVLTDRQQLNCLLCIDAWLARREELCHLPPQVGEILKFRRLWDGSNISDRDAIVLVWDDGARTCEYAFLFTTTSSFSAALIFCACARAHAYTPTLDRVLESRLDGLLVVLVSILIMIPISKFAGVMEKNDPLVKMNLSTS